MGASRFTSLIRYLRPPPLAHHPCILWAAMRETPSPQKPNRGSQAQDLPPWYVTLGKVESEKSQTPYVSPASTHTLISS